MWTKTNPFLMKRLQQNVGKVRLQKMDIPCFMESNYKHETNHWGLSSAFIFCMAKDRTLF